MPLMLPQGSEVPVVIPSFSYVGNLSPIQRDVTGFLVAVLAHPMLWPEAKSQHIAILNHKIDQQFPTNPDAVSTGFNVPRAERRRRELRDRREARKAGKRGRQ